MGWEMWCLFSYGIISEGMRVGRAGSVTPALSLTESRVTGAPTGPALGDVPRGGGCLRGVFASGHGRQNPHPPSKNNRGQGTRLVEEKG